jgi:riboflavin biosynthesis pyrimidine reductase
VSVGHITIVKLGGASAQDDEKRHVPIAAALSFLKRECGIGFVDACAGGSVFAQLLREGLIDEWRVTQSGQV